MAKEQLLYQCKLERVAPLGTMIETTVGWLEERAAYPGRQVELLEMPDPERKWTVTHAYLSLGMTKKELSEKVAADRKQRQASDI